jgi:hypothetical protein
MGDILFSGVTKIRYYCIPKYPMQKVFFLPLSLILVFSSCKKQGCTDPNANNYNSSANQDNGN